MIERDAHAGDDLLTDDELADLGVFYEVAAPPAPSPAEPRDPADGTEVDLRTQRWIRPEDLDAYGSLRGGSLLTWIDEEATTCAIVRLGHPRVVTRLVSEIGFVGSARRGDLVELDLRATSVGRTSVTLRAEVRHVITGASIVTVDAIVLVSLDAAGRPTPHGRSGPADEPAAHPAP